MTIQSIRHLVGLYGIVIVIDGAMVTCQTIPRYSFVAIFGKDAQAFATQFNCFRVFTLIGVSNGEIAICPAKAAVEFAGF